MVGGRSSLARMRTDAEKDPIARAAMDEARAMIMGDADRPSPEVWWSDGEPSLPSPPVGDAPLEPVHTAPEREPPAPDDPDDEDDGVIDATFEDVASETAPAPPADPAPPSDDAPQLPAAAAQLPAAPEAPPREDAPSAAWDGTATPLPSTLPTEARALCRLLGMVAASDRSTVVDALRRIDDPSALGDLWIAWQPGGDRALGRGVALAAAALERTAFLTKATTMANDEEALVRAAAVEAIGALGGASALTRVNRKLTDASPEVRAAAARALAAMGHRLGRQGMASSWLQAAADDADPDVKQAVAEAIEGLA